MQTTPEEENATVYDKNSEDEENDKDGDDNCGKYGYDKCGEDGDDKCHRGLPGNVHTKVGNVVSPAEKRLRKNAYQPPI